MTIDDDLRDAADDVRSLDADACERLESLADALTPGANAATWAGMDVLRALDPAGVAALVRGRPLPHAHLGRAEWVRGLLLLLLAALSLLGPAAAALNYRAALDADPALASRPFLLLWQEGFAGYADGLLGLFGWLTFSRLVLADAVLICAAVALAWWIERERTRLQAGCEAAAQAWERRLHHLGWRASLALTRRTSPSAVAEPFVFASEELLDELRAERERIAQIADAREREAGDFASLVADFARGAAEMSHLVDGVRAAFDTFADVGATLDARLAALALAQTGLEDALRDAAGRLAAAGSRHEAAAIHLEAGARGVVEAAEQGAIAVADVGANVALLRAELYDLRDHLIAERRAYQSAALTAEAAATALMRGIHEAAAMLSAIDAPGGFSPASDGVAYDAHTGDKGGDRLIGENVGSAAFHRAGEREP